MSVEGFIKNLPVDEDTPIKKSIVANVFQDINNYMKDGVLLRKIVNIIDAVDFYESTERHLFDDIYESMSKELQSQGSSGEFYTPPCGHRLRGRDGEPRTRREHCGFRMRNRRFPHLHIEAPLQTEEDQR